MLERAVELPVTHGDRAAAFNALGILDRYEDHLEAAAARYREARELGERTWGADAPESAKVLHNVAGLAHAKGAFAEGEVAVRRAIRINEREHGPDDPSVAADLSVLGAILIGLNRLDEAETALRRALRIWLQPSRERARGCCRTRTARPAYSPSRLRPPTRTRRHPLRRPSRSARPVQPSRTILAVR